MAGPHPVVTVPSELADGGGWGEYQPDVGVVAVDGEDKFAAAIVAVDDAGKGGVLTEDLFADEQTDGIGCCSACRLVHGRSDGGEDTARHIFLPEQEADIEVGAG